MAVAMVFRRLFRIVVTSKNALEFVVVVVKPDLEKFENIYRQIHRNTELSKKEQETADYISAIPYSLKFQVTDNLGVYGVIIMLRSEFDALPIEEETGWGREQPTMHACGHDIHMECLLSGTLIVLFQPNEEYTGSARSMVEDGLYNRVPVPDVILAQNSGPFKAGTLATHGGTVPVSADTMYFKIFSSLGHSANSQVNADPVLLTSKILLSLEELTSDLAGERYASISVDEIHVGSPGQDRISHVEATLDIKTYDLDLRLELLDKIKKLAIQHSNADGVQQPPEFTTKVRAPSTHKSEQHASDICRSFVDFWDEEIFEDQIPKHPYEDFSHEIDATRLNEAAEADGFLGRIPLNHSPYNKPTLQPSVQIGTDAFALAAFTFLV
ncbi:metal-dependent amidase/aminoacylase/carboxypeptidase [Biscogniauxia marginata]|nr:metal-dependent amidase/aminoacylase/carboxypeptidase [Biscogniauxia marginata]